MIHRRDHHLVVNDPDLIQAGFVQEIDGRLIRVSGPVPRRSRILVSDSDLMIYVYLQPSPVTVELQVDYEATSATVDYVDQAGRRHRLRLDLPSDHEDGEEFFFAQQVPRLPGFDVPGDLLVVVRHP